MTFTTNNNIRFTDKDNFPCDFIADNKDRVVILINDLILDFENGKYEGCSVFPF